MRWDKTLRPTLQSTDVPDKSDAWVAKNPSGLSRIWVKEGYFSKISRIRRPETVRVIEDPTYHRPTYRGTPVQWTLCQTVAFRVTIKYRYVSLYQTSLCRKTGRIGRCCEGSLLADWIALLQAESHDIPDTLRTPDQSGLTKHVCIHMRCKLRRHAASTNHVLCYIWRLPVRHLALPHTSGGRVFSRWSSLYDLFNQCWETAFF